MGFKLGVTGTQLGMNETQFDAVYSFMSELPKDTELHHGDCIGVDVEVAMIAESLGFKVICHPPTNPDKQAGHSSSEFREPFTYLRRNRNIVDEIDMLIAVPKEDNHQIRGGTWYTVTYAKKFGKLFKIFYPDGRINNYF
jgi:hypothetical protein